MRSRVPLLTLLFAVSLFALPVAAHASIPFFGPIVPDAINRCAAGWAAVIDVVNRLIEFLITLAIVFVAPLMLAWAGFLYVVNPMNPSGISKAKDILTNTVIGIVIALSGWLIVGAVMAVLYNSTTPVSDRSTLKVWSDIISSGGKPFCLIQESLLQNLNQSNLGITGISGTGVVTTSAGLQFDPGIGAQIGDESGQLATLLSCIAGRLPAGVGRVSSISDSLITNGQKTFSQCASGGCQHQANSCHYGGRTCIGKSYAVDFGDDENMSILTTAAQACGAQTLNEGTHLHASVGASSGCGCGL